MPLYPISFSIPEELVVREVPRKTQLFATREKKFANETDYYTEYQRSVYGHTSKKEGWDCLRHYEILANGCIPFFIDMDQLPPLTMVDFPRKLVQQGMNGDWSVAPHLLEYTRTHLTTTARARYIMETLGIANARSVLYLVNNQSPDYLRDSVLHGFKTIFGSQCVDVQKVAHMYDSYPSEAALDLYGKGFTYSRRILDEVCDRTNIDERIKQHEFDIIVYGSACWGRQPYFETVLEAYDPCEIAFLCGEDGHHLTYHPKCKIDSSIFNLFKREIT